MPPQLVLGVLIVGALLWSDYRRRKRPRPGIPLPPQQPLTVIQLFPELNQ